MEALNFLKVWRPTATNHKENQPFNGITNMTEISSSIQQMEDEFDEGEDSFIDLELALPDFDKKNNSIDSREDPRLDKNGGDVLLKSSSQPSPSMSSSNDVLSKRRVMPIDQPSSSRPQSPMSLLKSAPRFRVSIFKKSKSVAPSKTEEATELNRENSKKLYAVKFQIEDTATTNISILTRDTSLRANSSSSSSSSTSTSSCDMNSKRFSKEVIQKYLKLIKFKPLYIKVSRRNNNTCDNKAMMFSGELPNTATLTSVASSPAMFSPRKEKEKEKQPSIQTGFRVVCKHLNKSRSASAAVTAAAASATVSRSNDSLLLQHDGIQSAILHCKRSFNSSRESSLLSRCTSDSSQEKMYFTSSRDSSVSSGSDFSSDKSIASARNSNSIEERIGFIV